MRKFNWKRGIIVSGLMSVAVLVMFYPIVYGHDAAPDVSYDDIHNCFPIPDDVPRTFKNGKPIGWDCEMASFYYNDDLNFYYDENGQLLAIEKTRR